MAKLIFDIDDNEFEKIKCAYKGYFDCPISLKLCDATILSTNVTNGDIIKAMFPNLSFNAILSKMYASCGQDLLDWWDAPYRTENEVNNGKVNN